MEAGPRGPDGNAKGLRDLRQRIPQVVMEDDDGAVLRRQPAEGVLEGFAIGDGARRIGRRSQRRKGLEVRVFQRCVPRDSV